MTKEQYNIINSTENIKINTIVASVEETRKKYENAYKSWTDGLDNELKTMYLAGIKTKDMMKHFDRSRGAITSRIKKLGLKELYRKT
ncbi:MAG TPA: hypothetical protein VGF30_05780 [Bacteroidia bacterium]